MRACVTGGAGFIGSHLVRRLVQRGDEVTIIDNLLTGSLANLDGVLDDVRFVRMDLSKPDPDLPEVLRGAECVFHLAAFPSVAASVEDPLRSHGHCGTATLVVLHAMQQAGVGRIVYSSSCALYGDQPELPWRTDMLPRPMSPYAADKLAGEYYAAVFQRLYGVNAVSLRYFNVYGPGQPAGSAYATVIPRFLSAIRQGVPPIVYGDGGQTRDFVHVSDVVEANVRAAAWTGPHEAVNVGSGIQTSVLALLELLRRLRPGMLEPEFEPPRSGEIRHSAAELAGTERLLGWKPTVRLDEGLRELLAS